MGCLGETARPKAVLAFCAWVRASSSFPQPWKVGPAWGSGLAEGPGVSFLLFRDILQSCGME